MKKWIENVIQNDKKKAMPILSFPSVQLMGITVGELVKSSSLQAKGMKLVADRVDSLASVSMMDLSVEAEAFGSEVKFSEDEVPTIVGHIVDTYEDAENLKVPQVGEGRTGVCINAIKEACTLITDRPVFAGVIGPYSLAGRLLDVSEAMIKCYDEPDTVLLVLDKVTEFLINYINAYKETGAKGVVMAEPLAGLLSPVLMEEFSSPFVKKIIDAVQTDDFIVIYHNCGNNVIRLMDYITNSGASAYHFGDAIDMREAIGLISENVPVMGNVSPSGEFQNGSRESIEKTTKTLLNDLSKHKNFIISSGCDMPPAASWDNIDAFFKAVSDFYTQR